MTEEFSALHPYPEIYYDDEDWYMEEPECEICEGNHDEDFCPFLEDTEVPQA